MTLTIESARRKDEDAGLTKLQHRHFATIAHIICMIQIDRCKEETAKHFADILRRTNPKFDRVRFLTACGVN